MIGRAHKSLWNFIRKMKDEQRKVELSISAVRRGEALPPRRRKWREFEKRFRHLKRDYVEGTRSLRRYWKAVVYLIKTFV